PDEVSPQEAGSPNSSFRESDNPCVTVSSDRAATRRLSTRRRPLPLRGPATQKMPRSALPPIPPPASVRTGRGPRVGEHLLDVPHTQPLPGRAGLWEEEDGSVHRKAPGCDDVWRSGRSQQ